MNYRQFDWHPDYTVFIKGLSKKVDDKKSLPLEGKVGCKVKPKVLLLATRMRWNCREQHLGCSVIISGSSETAEPYNTSPPPAAEHLPQ